jgi:hypothetical protein
MPEIKVWQILEIKVWQILEIKVWQILEFHPKNEYFLNENKNNDDIYGAWLELQLELWQNDEGSMIVPKPFLQKFINECQDKDICFYNFNQNGTEEFINIFHQSIKKIIICLY